MGSWTGNLRLLGKLGLALLIDTWLLVHILIVDSHVFRNNTLSSKNLISNNTENSQHVSLLGSEFEIKKKQNETLENLPLGEKLKSPKDNLSGSVQDNATIYYNLLNQKSGVKFCSPSAVYEELRRRIGKNVQEMWYYFSNHLNKANKSKRGKDVKETFEMVREQKNSLMNDLDKLAKADDHQKCRDKETKELSDLVQRRFRYLQNPSDCNKAKKLICGLHAHCGFACQMHYFIACFIYAYRTERTVILKSEGWRHHKDGWECVFKPVSDTCLSSSGESQSVWPGDATNQVIYFPYNSTPPWEKYKLHSLPIDIATRLEKIHGHPIVWWIGQVLKYFLRPLDKVTKLLNNSKLKLGFEKPIVGIHVRRTDKIIKEAAFHDIDEYMAKVEQYFNQLENPPRVRRVFVACDDPKVLATAKKRYPKYKIIGDSKIAEMAAVSRRNSELSLHGLIIDINLLAQSDFLVCTLTSNVCRAAYELMQTYHTDAHDRVVSLDIQYYYITPNYNPHVVIINHKPRKAGELELRINDRIDGKVAENNYADGFWTGQNTRTNKTGRYPRFKVKIFTAAIEYPKYPHVPLIDVNISRT